jgi:hypothetical protein
MAASVNALLDEHQPRGQTEQHPERTDRGSPRLTPSRRSCERPPAQAQVSRTSLRGVQVGRCGVRHSPQGCLAPQNLLPRCCLAALG